MNRKTGNKKEENEIKEVDVERKTTNEVEEDALLDETEEESTDDVVIEEIRLDSRLSNRVGNSENSKEMRNEDIVKYDRQIRLFGVETQKKLLGATVQVFGTDNFISAEILKNLVLLGVGKIFVSKKILEFTKKIVPDDLSKINKSLVVEFSDKMESCHFRFIVDSVSLNADTVACESESLMPICSYFVCSRCLTLIFNGYEHECVQKEDKVLDVAYQCLAGAFAVQEYLKFIQEKSNVETFKIEF